MKTYDLRLTAICSCVLASALFFISCGAPANNVQNANSRTNTNANGNTATPTVKLAPPCDDTGINKAFADVIKGKKEFYDIRTQYNFHSKDCVIHLSGWTDKTEIFKSIEKEARGVTGVTGINNDEFWVLKGEARLKLPPPGGCPLGFKDCNDLCIPDWQDCNSKILLSVAPSPSPTAAPK